MFHERDPKSGVDFYLALGALRAIIAEQREMLAATYPA
jgi:hypothetical protein